MNNSTIKKIVTITSPSGAGKTSIVRMLLKEFDNFAFSVSATTRPIRDGETDGKDYYFISHDEFSQKIANGEFLEYEEVYPGILYGTLKKEVERLWAQNKTVIFDIDIKGAANIKRQFGKNSLVIFVKPPSMQALEARLKARKTETEQTIATRLKRAKVEMEFEPQADFVVLNEDLNEAYIQTKNAILQFLKAEIFS